MLENNTIYVYIFSNNDLDDEFILPSTLEEKLDKYKDITKRNIKKTKYNRLFKTLESNSIDTKSFKYDNGIPTLDNIYISTSDSKLYYGFSISKHNHGIDIEEEIDGKRKENLDKYLKLTKYDSNIPSIIKWTYEEAYSKYLKTGITKSSLEEEKKISDFINIKIDNTYISVYKKDLCVKFFKNYKEI